MRHRVREGRRSGILSLHAVALAILLFGVLRALGPCLSNWTTLGVHDWDSHASYRYLTVSSLLHYGQLPFWDPYSSGGFPSWGFAESAPNLVSPYLPVYLLLPIQAALRVEILGSTLTALVGMYVLCGRFTRSVAIRALVTALFVLNGRWALQVAAGHTWHLRYSLLPWIFWWFDRATQRSVRPTAWLARTAFGGLLFALMSYTGGIYPAPHTALLLGIYAAVLAVAKRTPRPLLTLATMGAIGFGLAAPRLFVVAESMRLYPRKTESHEALGLEQLAAMLTNRGQVLESAPVKVPIHGWHEYGLYLGWGGVLVLLLGLALARGARGNALRIAGLFAGLVGMGAFHPLAPWPLLHRLPAFSSQWVPSRWLFPAACLLALSFAGAAGRWLHPRLSRGRALDWALLVPVLLVTLDLSGVARGALEGVFRLVPPASLHAAADYHCDRAVPYHYTWLPNNGPLGAGAHAPTMIHEPPILLAMMANVCLVDAYGVPQYRGCRAVPRSSHEYRGEAHIEHGSGTAKMVRFSPNEVDVEIRGASAHAVVVYNQTWDPGWRANGKRVLYEAGLVAAPAPEGGTGIVQFRFRPRGLDLGLALFFVTVGALASAFFAVRSSTARAGLPSPRAPLGARVLPAQG